MDIHLALSSLITLSFFLAILPPSYCTDYARFDDCSRPYVCGGIKNISYPFWGANRPEYCGRQGFKLECSYDYGYPIPIIRFEEEFLVLNINQSQNIMTIARLDLLSGFCPETYHDTVLNYSIFDYASTVLYITLFYDCPSQVNTSTRVQNRFTCSLEGSDVNNNYYFVNESLAKIQGWELEKCRGRIRVPILRNATNESAVVVPSLHEALIRGFDVDYNFLDKTACDGCMKSGGNCGYSNETHPFVCFCRDGERSHFCTAQHNTASTGPIRTKKLKLIIGVAASGVGVLLTCIIIFWFRSKRSIIKSTKFRTKKTKNEQDLEAFIRDYGMMILEMAGGRNNIDVGVSQTSEIYFPHWIYKRLELDNDIGFLSNMTTAENEMVRKMILVGLWCIQTNPSDRPSMSKVIEMIEGNIEALKIPPKPFLCSPPRSHAEESSTTSIL
ncbi:hypothetical protein CMV_005509 [Castanea mollissima]|uniref:non-specific serine/threonine protein kinase n=1 Tax=Castanea mollissima TaxID=60419 RepID=A0A8J4RJN7_9ROSI|nr:hypothetical protein CMV_005509 [Castanea mollissima]